MTNPVFLIPEAMKGLAAFAKTAEDAGIAPKTLGLVHLRASQINGCALCVDMHPKLMRKLGETDERMFAVAVWRDAPYFDDAERAALALTEAVTRLADREDAVPDAVWDEAARHYDEPKLAALLIAIAAINVWNRLNVPTRQIPGTVHW